MSHRVFAYPKSLALGGAILLNAACTGQQPPPPADTPVTAGATSPCGPIAPGSRPETVTLREATNPIVADHEVAPTNIFERDLPDGAGKVARRVSCKLSIMHRPSKKQWFETVVEGSRFKLGEQNWCVEQIVKGQSEPGSVVLRRVEP